MKNSGCFEKYQTKQATYLSLFGKEDLLVDRHHDFVSTVSLAGDRFHVALAAKDILFHWNVPVSFMNVTN